MWVFLYVLFLVPISRKSTVLGMLMYFVDAADIIYHCAQNTIGAKIATLHNFIVSN